MPCDTISSKQSIYKLCRELKKEEHSLFNCLSSIVEDAAFCSEIRLLYSDLPLFANLRCGLWYAPRPNGTCYFKSTDGHQHHQTFSTTRLNWHVAEIAARKGGCIIVDATRKGKRAPDAMSKTIPIWAAVLNRAVARVRLHDAQKEQRRRSYTTQDGEVLTPVADTQTSISVRTDEPCSSQSNSAAVPAPQFQHKLKLEPQLQQCQQQSQQASLAQQQQQQLQEPSTCSIANEVEELLLDCMGDSCLELLSAGLSVAVARPGTPEQAHTQHMYSQLQRSPSYAAVGSSPAVRAGVLHRSVSLHLSPQPSLQEWLDEDDVLRRLALLHQQCCRSPARRMPRVSCHSIGRNGSSDASNVSRATGEAPAVLFASSAPASSCLLGSSLPHSRGRVLLLCDDSPPAAEAALPEQQQQAEQQQQQQQQQPRQGLVILPASTAAAGRQRGRQLEPVGFSVATGDAAQPVTPRLGCCGALAATFDNIHEALQDEQQQQQLCQLEQQEALRLPVGGPPKLASALSNDHRGDAAGEPGVRFAFPLPQQLAQRVVSTLIEAGSSLGCSGAAGEAGSSSSSSSSCGAAGLTLPDMPVVVLNGTSHQPGDAASILDIWRSTDLEDVATLPGISDFRPGVYHMPAEQDADNAGAEEFDFRHAQSQQQQQQQQQHKVSSHQLACSNDWVLVDGQQVKAAGSAGTACSVGSSAESRGSWMDEESGVGYDGLCAFASPPLAVPAAAAAVAGDSSGVCSSSSVTGPRPGRPSTCSTHSVASERSSSTSSSAAAAQPAADSSGGITAGAAAEVEWDTSLHLPLWVPVHERQAIEAKLDGWVERLLEVGADVRGLAAQLHKPLRPLWVTQDSLIWTNQVAHPSSLPFTPLVLVSASQPHKCDRQAARTYGASAAAGLGMQDLDDLSDDELPGSGSASKAAAPKLGRSGSKAGASGQQQLARGGSGDMQVSSWSYVYVPGAGDDEESWALGLTPGLFWEHCEALLSCGPAGVGAAVKQLLAHYRGLACSRSSNSTSSCSIGQRLLQLAPHRVAGSPPAHGVRRDRHHPAPKGCAGGSEAAGLHAEAAAAGLKVVRAAPGVYWLGGTGLALGNLEGATAADVWRTVDAVLCCGTAMSPALQQEYQSMQLRAEHVPAVPGAVTCDALGAVWRGSLDSRLGSSAAAGLCFKPMFSWQGSSHVQPVSSSYSSCSEWARQQRPQQQQQQQQPEQRGQCALVAGDDAASSSAGGSSSPAAAAAEAGGGSDHLTISKSDVPAAAEQAKRKGGMLTELLSKSKTAPQPHARQAGRPRSRHAHTSSVDSAGSCGAAASDSSASCSDSACSSTCYSSSSDDSAAGPAGACRQQMQLPRLKWLPVECAKRDRSGLKQHLQDALEFVSAHLAAGHHVLLHDVEGHDSCVCMAVATLLACFTPPDAAAASCAAAVDCGPHFLASWTAGQQEQQQLPPEPVSKHCVRQRLALVSSCYPPARPTRGSLKQVFNFFEERRRAAAGSSSSSSGFRKSSAGS